MSLSSASSIDRAREDAGAEPGRAPVAGPQPARVAAVFDLDGTITKTDTYVRFLLFCLRRNPARCVRVPVLGLGWAMHATGLRSNTWLKRYFLRHVVAGVARDVIDLWCEEFVSTVLRNHVRRGALRAIEAHRSAGHTLILTTASFDFYVERLAAALGFHHTLCTRSAWSSAQSLLGTIAGENCHGTEKIRRLEEHFGTRRKDWHVYVYTDHHSDLPLLRWADRAIVVNPTAKLARIGRTIPCEQVDWDD